MVKVECELRPPEARAAESGLQFGRGLCDMRQEGRTGQTHESELDAVG